jgi:mono/diheme cytochrome c family protein
MRAGVHAAACVVVAGALAACPSRPPLEAHHAEDKHASQEAGARLGSAETLKRMGVGGVSSGMPGFAETLSDDEIMAVLDYIKSRWSDRSRAYQAEITRQDQ